jgi:hypothetical protein
MAVPGGCGPSPERSVPAPSGTASSRGASASVREAIRKLNAGGAGEAIRPGIATVIERSGRR